MNDADHLLNYHQGIIDWVSSTILENPSPGDKGKAFCQWCLEHIFNLSSDDALDAQEMAGNHDHGIDAAFTQRDGELIILQTKYESSHSWSEITRFHYDMQRIVKNKVAERDANASSHRAIADIRDAYNMGWLVRFYYITSATFTDTEKSKLSTLDGINTDFYFYDLPAIAEYLDGLQENVPESIRGQCELRPSFWTG